MENSVKILVDELNLIIPEKIYNDETGEEVAGDPGRIEEALLLVARARLFTAELARIMCEFFDKKLYLYLGLTKDEACKRLFGMNPRTVSNLQYLYRQLGSHYSELEYLGPGKMKAIADIPEKQREEFLSDGEIELATGEVLKISDLGDTRVAELEEKLKLLKLSHSALKNQKEEEKKKLTSEVKSLKKNLDDLQSFIDIKPEEKEFHQRITMRKESRDLIARAGADFNAGFARLSQIIITEHNEDVLADIEGLLVSIARRIIDFETHFGIHLGAVKSELKLVK